jgi:6-phosphogluconate dehydrogenase
MSASALASASISASAWAHIGVTGLGVMGRDLARNFARHGYTVAVHNRTASRARALVEEFGEEFGDEGRFVTAGTAEEFVAALERPRRLVIMVQAGAATDAVIDELAALLDSGDMIIDGGNAHFADTRRREAACGSAVSTSSAPASPAVRRVL